MFSTARLTPAPITMCLAASTAAGAAPQSTQKKEAVAKPPTTASTTQLMGEVVSVGPDWLVAKMVPGGDYRLFNVKPGAMATVEGVKTEPSPRSNSAVGVPVNRRARPSRGAGRDRRRR